MKRVNMIMCVLVSFLLIRPFKGAAQSDEAQQLLLNVEKLAQLKQILSDLKKGYNIVFKGYTTIKNISQGNFKLHQTFLDGLLQVSPLVQQYKRIGDIITCQRHIINEYHSAFGKFKENKNFTLPEINY